MVGTNPVNLQDPICQQAEQKIEAGLGVSQRDAYFKIVSAGMKLALNKGPNGLMASLTKSKDPLSDVVQGAIAIVLILRRQSVGTMPLGVMTSAAMTLVLQGLDFCEKSKIIPQITTDMVAQATQLFINTILPKLGISPDRMQQMQAQTHGLLQDPAKLAALKANGVNVNAATAPAAPTAGATNVAA